MPKKETKVLDKKPFDPTAPTVSIDYIKGANFKAVRADGAIGGITPNGHIHMAFFSERNAIPRRMTYEVTEDGSLGEVVDMESRLSVVREMDVDVFLSLEAAREFSKWLIDNINELEKGTK